MVSNSYNNLSSLGRSNPDPRAEKLQGIIDRGRVRVPQVLREIEEEFHKRQDVVVKPGALGFRVVDGENGSGREIRAYLPSMEDLGFSGFSRGQLLARAGLPVAYADKLLGLGEDELLLDNLNTMLDRTCKDGLLLRIVDDTARGVLSPAYRRMDAAPIYEGFISAAVAAGYVPYTGRVTDYRYTLSFVLPEVFQPRPDEFILMGLSITTSDYGSSALVLPMNALRITCLNLCMGLDVMRSVHVGRRFESTDDLVTLSNKTHDLDNSATASAVADAVESSVKMQAALRDRIHEAAQAGGVNISDEVRKLRSKGIRKDIAESIKTAYEGALPVEILPPEASKWRLSNAISYIANGSGLAADVSLDLQKAAMDVL